MSTTRESSFADFRAPTTDPTTGIPLPASDDAIVAATADLELLAERWRAQAALSTMTAEEMRGADARAQRLGTPGLWLMEQAGAAVGAVARALLITGERSHHVRPLILCGPGNNGGDGLVAARYLARLGFAL